MENHQTVRLGRGSHGTPDRGACVMELASMLAGESFTDKPKSVSPVIAGFLRVYNDTIDDRRRQDLYAYAARVVGTRAPRPVEQSRGLLCIDRTRRLGTRVPLTVVLRPSSAASGALAARSFLDREDEATHADALAFVDELIGCGDSWAGVPADARDLFSLAAEHSGSTSQEGV